MARKQTIIVIDANEEHIAYMPTISELLERETDWIVIAGKEERFVFEWDDDLRVNNEECTFTEATMELAQIAERKEE